MATWQYTLFFAPYSVLEIFTPDITGANTGDEYIRLFLQFDEIFCMVAGFLWLLYLFGDLKKAGMVGDSWAIIILKGVATFMIAGPGATIGMGWLWREKVLATKWHKHAIVAVEGKKEK